MILQIQPEQQPKTNSCSALQIFLTNYAQLLNQNQNIQMDMDKVINDLSAQISYLPPPTNSNEKYKELWKQGICLQKEQISKISNKLHKLNEQKLHQTIVNLQKLNSKLTLQYNTEINRSIQFGLLKRKGLD